jgi:hypothetical protein
VKEELVERYEAFGTDADANSADQNVDVSKRSSE